VDDPFSAPGEWLRCALHAHTTNSDGELPPDKLVRHYDWAGFDVLAITDHWVRTEADGTERLLVVPSTELDAVAGEEGANAHVLALGVEADPPPRPTHAYEPLADVVRWVLDNGGVPFLAHTYWSGLRAGDFEACEGLVGLEVWNAGCELEIGRGGAWLHWDEVLERGRALLGIATDDSHHPGFDSALAWVWVRAAERTQAAVLDALRAGAFYSSCGPVLHAVEVADDEVVVRCSPAASVTLFAERMRGARVNAGRLGYPHRGRIAATNDDGEIVEARLRPAPGLRYGRVEVCDRDGRRAWSNPLWMR
jgi:hypothetical protein